MTSRQAAWCYSLNSEGKSHADVVSEDAGSQNAFGAYLEKLSSHGKS
jgi:hypothetical protein